MLKDRPIVIVISKAGATLYLSRVNNS